MYMFHFAYKSVYNREIINEKIGTQRNLNTCPVRIIANFEDRLRWFYSHMVSNPEGEHSSLFHLFRYLAPQLIPCIYNFSLLTSFFSLSTKSFASFFSC